MMLSLLSCDRHLAVHRHAEVWLLLCFLGGACRDRRRVWLSTALRLAGLDPGTFRAGLVAASGGSPPKQATTSAHLRMAVSPPALHPCRSGPAHYLR